MDIQHLEVFLVAAEQLHFGRASQLCHMSPSALTRTIQRLEEQVGKPLFIRDNRHVFLSEAGELFRSYAREAIQQWRSFKQELRDDNYLSGNLSIYASITAVYSILPGVLERYRQCYPEVQIHLHSGAAEQAMDQVNSGEIDIAVAALPAGKRAQMEFLPLTTTPLVFIAPASVDPLEDPRCNGMLDLSRVNLVVPQYGLSRERLNQWLKTERVAANISSEVSGNEALIALVRIGGGIGVVPKLVLQRSPFCSEVRIIDNAPQLDPYEVGLCCNRSALQLPSVRAFWKMAVEQATGQRVE